MAYNQKHDALTVTEKQVVRAVNIIDHLVDGAGGYDECYIATQLVLLPAVVADMRALMLEIKANEEY
jgi:hypothetical protein